MDQSAPDEPFDPDEIPDVPTFDDAVRLWHHAITRPHEESLIGVLQCAEGSLLDDELDAREQARLWVRSIRHVRDEGGLDDDTAWYLMWDVVLTASEARYDAELDGIGDRMLEVERAHGLAPREDFHDPPDPPAEWRALDDRYRERWREIRCDLLREAGEASLAGLVERDLAAFEKRMRPVEERLDREHDELLRRLRGGWCPPGVERVGIKHYAFFEAIAHMPEGSPEDPALTGGLLALRMLDHYFLAGAEIVQPDSKSPRSVRALVDQLPRDDPLRSALFALVNRMQRAPVDGVDAVPGDLLAIAEAYRARGAERLAADVCWTIVQSWDAEEAPAVRPARRMLLDIERRLAEATST